MKKFLLLLTCLAMLVSLCVTAGATEDKILIWDEAQLLAEDEVEKLQNLAQQISENYSMDLLIVTVETTGYKSVETYAEDFYLDNGYGYGDEQSGIILLLAMDTREWTVRTFGEGRDALSDSQSEDLMDGILSTLSNGMYYSAFHAYLNDLEEVIRDYSEVTTDEILILVAIALGVGALVGFITIKIMKSGMKTAVFQHGARDYVRGGSFKILANRDIFLYSNVTRVRRSSDSSSSGRSGGRSGGSSGRF